MEGIDLNSPVVFKHSSLRYFLKNEHHITRFCDDDVLLLVFDGVLRFSVNGIRYEVRPGEYFIQKNHTDQGGEEVSDSPKYLYVHFLAEWGEGEDVLPLRGNFDYPKLKTAMEELDEMSHGNFTYIEKSAKFYEILLSLRRKKSPTSLAAKIASFIEQEYLNEISLEMICKEFSFSKNHIINIFKKEYGKTPIKYINDLKLRHAEYLLEVTSDSIQNISMESRFNDYSHFYKLFCQKNAMSPAEWRRRKQLRPAKE